MNTFLIIVGIIYLIGYLPMVGMTVMGYLISPRAMVITLIVALSFYAWYWPMAYYRMITNTERHKKPNKYHPPKEDTEDVPKTNRS